MVLTCPVLGDIKGAGASELDGVDMPATDGVGERAGIYRNMSQNRQLSLGNSAQIFINVPKGKFYATSSLGY